MRSERFAGCQAEDCWKLPIRCLSMKNHKTMRSHAQLVSASKARAGAIFVDLMVLSLGRKSRARETSEVPKMTGICLAAERMKRCVQFTDREREIEAEMGATKVLVEDVVTWNSVVDLYGKRDPSVKGKHQSEQELSSAWFTGQKDQNEDTSAIDASVSPWSNEWRFNECRSLEDQEAVASAGQSAADAGTSDVLRLSDRFQKQSVLCVWSVLMTRH